MVVQNLTVTYCLLRTWQWFKCLVTFQQSHPNAMGILYTDSKVLRDLIQSKHGEGVINCTTPVTHIAHSGGTEAGALGAFADFFALSQMDAAIVTRQSTFSMSAMLQGGRTASPPLALAKGNYLGIVGHSQSKQPVTHNEFCTAKLGFEWPKGLVLDNTDMDDNRKRLLHLESTI
jgi:hypothetical protein